VVCDILSVYVEVGMENIDMLLWAIGGGFAGTWIALGFVCKMLFFRIDKLDEKLTDVDRRLCRLEGAFSSKECCILHHHENRKEE